MAGRLSTTIDALRVPGRERHRVVAAHGVADHGHPAPAEGVHHADQVLREILGGVRLAGRPLARSMAALVEREHVVAVDEGGHDRVEPVRVRGAAVEEAERRPPTWRERGRAISHPKRVGSIMRRIVLRGLARL
jgi:hypothetical protein